MPLPNEHARTEIFRIHTKQMQKNNINLKRLAKETEGMSGADIRAVCTESGYLAIRTNRKLIELDDFLKSIDKVRKNDLGEASGMFG